MITTTVTVTMDDIRAAQNSDLAATTLVIQATESRVSGLANKAAHRMAATGDRLESYREEFAQIGRIAVWDALARFTGDTVDNFFGYIYATVEATLMDAAREERNGAAGADKDAVKTFGAVLRDQAQGDVYLAERLVQELPTGKRLGADRANAARMAWQGSASLDAPAAGTESFTLGESLAAPATDEPEVSRPKVGHGAALEALSVLERYTTAYGMLDTLPVNAADVDAIADAIIVPRDPAVRRYVLDAVSILHSYVSTVADGVVAADLRNESDDRLDDRAAKHRNVDDALGKMGAGQRDTLVNSFGINGAQEFGWGDDGELMALAEFLGITYPNAKAQRSKAKVAFARYYIAIVAVSEADALEWAAAAEEMRKHGGRK